MQAAAVFVNTSSTSARAFMQRSVYACMEKGIACCHTAVPALGCVPQVGVDNETTAVRQRCYVLAHESIVYATLDGNIGNVGV